MVVVSFRFSVNRIIDSVQTEASQVC